MLVCSFLLERWYPPFRASRNHRTTFSLVSNSPSDRCCSGHCKLIIPWGKKRTQETCFNNCAHIHLPRPCRFLTRLPHRLSTPFIAVMGQRLVLNLRRLRARPDSTRDLSREVARQMAAMPLSTTDDEQTDPQSDLGLELGVRAVG